MVFEFDVIILFSYEKAYMTQFWLLAQYFWLNVMCIDIRHAVNASKLIVQSSKRRFTVYCLYAWGCPLLVSVFTFLCDRFLENNLWKPGFVKDDCWFRKYSGHYFRDPKFLYFYSVITVILVVNLYIFFNTAVIILARNQEWKQKHTESRRHRQRQKRFSLHLKLFILMGLNWILDMASYYIKLRSMADLWFVIDMVNSLHGVFICSIFVCNKKVIRLLKKRFFPRRTFSQEYARLISNRNFSSSSKQFRTSSTTSRLSSSQKDMDTITGNAET